MQQNQSPPPQQAYTSQPSSTLYMTNFSKQMTRDNLYELFQPYGAVTDIALFSDVNIVNPYAFVKFVDLHSAANAIQALNNSTIMGCVIKVSFKKTKNPNYIRDSGRDSLPRDSRRSHEQEPRHREYPPRGYPGQQAGHPGQLAVQHPGAPMLPEYYLQPPYMHPHMGAYPGRGQIEGKKEQNMNMQQYTSMGNPYKDYVNVNVNANEHHSSPIYQDNNTNSNLNTNPNANSNANANSNLNLNSNTNANTNTNHANANNTNKNNITSKFDITNQAKQYYRRDDREKDRDRERDRGDRDKDRDRGDRDRDRDRDRERHRGESNEGRYYDDEEQRSRDKDNDRRKRRDDQNRERYDDRNRRSTTQRNNPNSNTNPNTNAQIWQLKNQISELYKLLNHHNLRIIHLQDYISKMHSMSMDKQSFQHQQVPMPMPSTPTKNNDQY